MISMGANILNFPKFIVKQLRFATISALNTSALATREEINESMRAEFTLRNKWTERGTRVVKARVSRPVARVGTIRENLEDHVTGDVRRGRNAIPIDARKRPEQLLRKRRWPGAYREKPRFIYKSVGRVRGLWRVVGRGRGRRVRTMWIIPERQKVEARWDFELVARRSHEANFSKALPSAIDHALSTAKPSKPRRRKK